MPSIYLGHPKDGDSESVELRALGLKFNKSEPSRIGLIGLRTIEQPGYESYVHHLSGFMYANDTQVKQKLIKVGFPIKLPLSKCFPLLQPPLHLRASSAEGEKAEIIFNKYRIEFEKSRQKTGKDEFSIFTIKECISALGPIRSVGNVKSHAPNGQVSFDGLLSFLLTKRIFSSFFRTHTYPAYSAPTEEEDYTGLKRRFDEEHSSKKKLRLDKANEEGGAEIADGDAEMTIEQTEDAEDKIVLRYAKPSDSTVAPWALGSNDIPHSYGIVFPFVHQMANWDKDMVPRVMETHFLRCFGDDDEKISAAFSKFVESWRSETYSTYAGLVLSHMAKVISIALPAQARPFPIFEEEQYKGCYLIGANFSVALKATLIKPVPFDENKTDLTELFGRMRLLSYIEKEVIEESDGSDFKQSEFISLRGIHEWLRRKGYSFTIDGLQTIRALAANANFRTRYNPTDVEHVFSAISNAIEDKFLDDAPIHYEAFCSNDPFEVNLSSFGPGVPSPHIPGGKEISVFKAPPMQSTVCFRRCQLRSAVTEWKDVLDKGSVRNEPKNLNARFQFVRVSGTEDKVKWYQSMEHVIRLAKEKNLGPGTKAGAESYVKKGNSDAVDDLFDF